MIYTFTMYIMPLYLVYYCIEKSLTYGWGLAKHQSEMRLFQVEN